MKRSNLAKYSATSFARAKRIRVRVSFFFLAILAPARRRFHAASRLVSAPMRMRLQARHSQFAWITRVKRVRSSISTHGVSALKILSRLALMSCSRVTPSSRSSGQRRLQMRFPQNICGSQSIMRQVQWKLPYRSAKTRRVRPSTRAALAALWRSSRTRFRSAPRGASLKHLNCSFALHKYASRAAQHAGV